MSRCLQRLSSISIPTSCDEVDEQMKMYSNCYASKNCCSRMRNVDNHEIFRNLLSEDLADCSMPVVQCDTEILHRADSELDIAEFMRKDRRQEVLAAARRDSTQDEEDDEEPGGVRHNQGMFGSREDANAVLCSIAGVICVFLSFFACLCCCLPHKPPSSASSFDLPPSSAAFGAEYGGLAGPRVAAALQKAAVFKLDESVHGERVTGTLVLAAAPDSCLSHAMDAQSKVSPAVPAGGSADKEGPQAQEAALAAIQAVSSETGHIPPNSVQLSPNLRKSSLYFG